MPKSKSDDWETPDIVFKIIEKEFSFSKDQFFDPCPLNYKLDALNIEWNKINFVNPPYSLLKEFISKSIQESKTKIIILLLPCKTDQQWFHDIWKLRNHVYWFKGRLKFKNAKWHATQPHFLIKI